MIFGKWQSENWVFWVEVDVFRGGDRGSLGFSGEVALSGLMMSSDSEIPAAKEGLQSL